MRRSSKFWTFKGFFKIRLHLLIPVDAKSHGFEWNPLLNEILIQEIRLPLQRECSNKIFEIPQKMPTMLPSRVLRVDDEKLNAGATLLLEPPAKPNCIAEIG